MKHAIDIERFSTDGMNARTAYAVWRDRPSSFGRLFETCPQHPFATRSTEFSLGTLRLGFSTIGSMTWQRDAAMARADGVDLLAVNVRFSGEAWGDAADGSFTAAGTSIVLADMAQPSRHLSAASRTVVLAIPRAQAEAVLGPVRALHGAVISPAASAMLRAHMLHLEDLATHIPVDQGVRMGGVLLDLLAIGLAMDGRAVAVSDDVAGGALKQRALATMDARLGSATLNPANIARALGVSRSTLYRLFAAEGGVAACIRSRRLDRVHALLGEPASIEPVALLAERWGFCDAAHFGRLFRERYGMTPGDYRAMRHAQRLL